MLDYRAGRAWGAAGIWSGVKGKKMKPVIHCNFTVTNQNEKTQGSGAQYIGAIARGLI